MSACRIVRGDAATVRTLRQCWPDEASRSRTYGRSVAFPIRFQVLTLAGRPWPEYRDQVKRIEDLGFDVAAVPDHFCDWANPPAPWLECWTLLAALATETTTVRLASNVAQIPLRNPGVLAHQAITVDHVSDGRLELGLGTGLMIDPGTDMVGLANWSNKERVERFGEYLELVGLLLEQDETSYTGTYYSASDAVMNPSSLQRPPRAARCGGTGTEDDGPCEPPRRHLEHDEFQP